MLQSTDNLTYATTASGFTLKSGPEQKQPLLVNNSREGQSQSTKYPLFDRGHICRGRSHWILVTVNDCKLYIYKIYYSNDLINMHVETKNTFRIPDWDINQPYYD